MKQTRLILALFLWLLPCPLNASEVSFLKFCEYLEMDSEDLSKDAKAVTISCVAFIKGVIETHAAMVLEKKIEPQFCKPPRISYGKVGLMYVDYAGNHSRKSFQSEAEFLLQALKAAYPCN